MISNGPPPGINPYATFMGYGNPLDPLSSWGPMRTAPPPNGAISQQELAFVRQANQRANANPNTVRFTELMAEKGGTGLWKEYLRQYRSQVGFFRGWAGTALTAAVMGITALRTQKVKKHFHRQRPYQVDGTIQTIGKLPKDAGYPSGHASSAYAAATTLSFLWPARTQEFAWWARQVAQSRVAAGVHFPSDVMMGAQLGRTTALQVMDIL